MLSRRLSCRIDYRGEKGNSLLCVLHLGQDSQGPVVAATETLQRGSPGRERLEHLAGHASKTRTLLPRAHQVHTGLPGGGTGQYSQPAVHHPAADSAATIATPQRDSSEVAG
jgi:hypothetical protein